MWNRRFHSELTVLKGGFLMKHRSNVYRFLGLVVVLLLTMVLAATVLADGKGRNSGEAVGFTPIVGSPLTINVAVDGSYQVIHDAVEPSTPGQVYPTSYDEADAGIFVWYGNYVVGPDFDNHDISASNSYDAWSNVSQSPVTGSGTAVDPYVVSTSVSNGASGVTADINTTYVDGEDYFRIDWTICVPTPGDISTFLAADFYLQGSDAGYPYYDPATGSIGGANETLDWYQIFTPITPADAYMEAYYGTIWQAIGQAGLPGPGFDNTVDETLIDNGGGLQWNEAVTSCSTFASWWSFGVTPEPPPTSVSLTGGLVGEGHPAGALYLALLLVVVVGGAWLVRRRLVSR
jgi:hypothetical protein